MNNVKNIMQHRIEKINIFAATAVFLVLPHIALAAGISDMIDDATWLVTNSLIPLAFVLCLLYFLWGVAKYIRTGAGGEKPAEEGKRVMVRGVIALVVVFSIWGIINLMIGAFGLAPFM